MSEHLLVTWLPSRKVNMTFCFHVVVILKSLFIGFETREGGPGNLINKRMNISPNLDYVNQVQENS